MVFGPNRHRLSESANILMSIALDRQSGMQTQRSRKFSDGHTHEAYPRIGGSTSRSRDRVLRYSLPISLVVPGRL